MVIQQRLAKIEMLLNSNHMMIFCQSLAISYIFDPAPLDQFVHNIHVVGKKLFCLFTKHQNVRVGGLKNTV